MTTNAITAQSLALSAIVEVAILDARIMNEKYTKNLLWPKITV